MDNNKNPFEKENSTDNSNGNCHKKWRDEYGRRESEGMVPGLMLIGIGSLWLLSKFNYINFSFSNLVRAFVDLWPLILVVAGVNLIFKRQRFVHSITWLIFLAILLFYSAFGPTFFGNKFDMFGTNQNHTQTAQPATNTQPSKQSGIESASFPMDKYTPAPKTGDMTLNLSAGDVTLGSDNDNLVAYVVPSGKLKEKTVDVSGEHANLVFSEGSQMPGHKGSSYNFYLGSDVAWNIHANSGAVDGNFDLENVKVNALDINTAASDLKLTLGNQNPMTTVKINGAATDLQLDVPNDSGLKVKISSLGKDNNLESKGLIKQGDYYVTPGFDTAANKIDVQISTAATDIKLDRH